MVYQLLIVTLLDVIGLFALWRGFADLFGSGICKIVGTYKVIVGIVVAVYSTCASCFRYLAGNAGAVGVYNFSTKDNYNVIVGGPALKGCNEGTAAHLSNFYLQAFAGFSSTFVRVT